jgi:hypothetical protein
MQSLRTAFANHGAVWQQWRNALAPIVRNDAAKVIAQHLIDAANTRVTAAPAARPAQTGTLTMRQAGHAIK